MKKSKYISFNGKTYAFNLARLKDVCLTSSSDGGTKEMEISQAYEMQDNGEFSLSSRVEHETKISGNPQNDMIVYDIVKLLIVSLLENNVPEQDFAMDLGTAVAINTLISWGVLEEINEI